ncbi:cyclic AMP response element-binding protein A-like isoform X1 [Eriocheir sinensis]|uniref:cyclic AMP response element-binding protein A-like isoform X1 n=1 Tax=Eriocheir sinensis TaxID=95602 RepID=UPI0021CA64B0|nr:cyclic AMP response element-binding protein A-like isoform X1 [Eriocheir sinensis]
MDIIDSTLADFAENDLKELWESDYYADVVKVEEEDSWPAKEALKVASEVDWAGVLEGGGGGGGGGTGSSGGSGGGSGVVLNDRLMTEASLGVISQLSTLGGFGGFSSLLSTHAPLESSHHAQLSATATTDADESISTTTTAAADVNSPEVKVEHSYSLASDSSHPQSPLSDLESECFPAIPISEAEGGSSGGGGGGATGVTTTTTTTTTTTATTRFTTYITDRGPTSSSPSTTTTTTACVPISITTTTSTPNGAQRKGGTSFCVSSSASSTSSSSSSSPPSPECEAYEFLPANAVLAMPSLKTSLGLVRPSAVVVTQRSGGGGVHTTTSRLGLSSLTLRLPSSSSSSSSSSTATSSASPSSSSASPTSSSDAGFYLPPTPPSCSSSDSECGGQSPTRTPPLYEALTPQFCNPRKVASRVTVSRNPINTPLISSQPKGATGAINLTEEEKRTLLSEGYNIPSRLPLTKAEEKSLKKIRRKIKNKISAQESRRKKKDYMDALERKVDKLSSENVEYKRRIEMLQTSNSQLLVELQQLQCLVEQDEKYRLRSSPIATLLS